MPRIPTRTLPSGDEIPVVGAGTWDLRGETAVESVRTALDLGYTHLDTAEGYENETEIGEAIADRDREDLLLTSKVLPSNLNYESLLDSLSASLDRLGTDYLDLYLVHWPNPAISIRETMDAMATARDRGLVRNVGVSNFTEYQLEFTRRVADVPIAVNQIEFHPWYDRRDLVDYCYEHDIVVEAAAPLARMQFVEDSVVAGVADEYGRTPAQVALKWEIERGAVVIPKSASEPHLRENIDLFDWDLDDEDLARIDAIDRMENVYMIDVDDDTYGIRT